MELPLEIIRVIFHLYKPEHIKTMFQKTTRFLSFGSCVEILDGKEGNPHNFSVNECKSQGKEKND